MSNFTTEPLLTTIPPGNGTLPDDGLSPFIVAFTLLGAIPSIFLSAFLLFTFTKISKKSSLILCFIKCLATADLLFCIGVVLGVFYYTEYVRSEHYCIAQSFLCTAADMVSFFYTLYVVLCVFSETVCASNWMKNKKAKVVYHLIAWLIPVCITTAAAISGDLGEAETQDGSWCWIRNDDSNDGSNDDSSKKRHYMWMLFTKQIWETLVYVISAVFLLISIWLNWLKTRAEKKKNTQKVKHVYETDKLLPSQTGSGQDGDTPGNLPNLSVMFWLGFYFYIWRIWGTVRNYVRIMELAYDDTNKNFKPFEKYFFVHLQSFGDGIQGTVNCIMFCFMDREVLGEVREFFSSKPNVQSLPENCNML